jgi:hypothetical protein
MSVKTMSPSAFNKVFIERGYTLDQWLDELLAVIVALCEKLDTDTGVADTDYSATIADGLPFEFTP